MKANALNLAAALGLLGLHKSAGFARGLAKFSQASRDCPGCGRHIVNGEEPCKNRKCPLYLQSQRAEPAG